MNLITFHADENQSFNSERNILSAFKQHSDKPKEIKQGMSPDEIADIVSDRLIEVVRHQFEEAKKQFQAKAKK